MSGILKYIHNVFTILFYTCDNYLLHKPIWHEIITIPMTLYLYVAFIPSIRISFVSTCQRMLSRFYATSLKILTEILISGSFTVTNSKLPFWIRTMMYRWYFNIETNFVIWKRSKLTYEIEYCISYLITPSCWNLGN